MLPSETIEWMDVGMPTGCVKMCGLGSLRNEPNGARSTGDLWASVVRDAVFGESIQGVLRPGGMCRYRNRLWLEVLPDSGLG